MFKPEVIQGGLSKPRGRYVCGWCGASFDNKNITSDGTESLEEHWRRNAICWNNKSTNNPTQSKYRTDVDD